MKHTPAPWRMTYEKPYTTILSKETSHVIYTGGGGNEQICEQQRANAARIVECVNACGSVENPQQLIEVASLVAAAEKSLAIEMNTLEEQRDELLAALKNLANAYSATPELEYGDTSKKPTCLELEAANQLLSKYKNH